MTRFNTWISICLLVLLFGGKAVESADEAHLLNGTKLTALLSSDLEFIVSGPKSTYFVFRADGTWYGKFQDVSGEGRWRIRGVTICAVLREDDAGQTAAPWDDSFCFGVERKKDRLYFIEPTGLRGYAGKELRFEDLGALARLDKVDETDPSEAKGSEDTLAADNNLSRGGDATNRYVALSGEQILDLFEVLKDVRFPNGESSNRPGDWIIAFSSDGFWEGKSRAIGANGEGSWGSWRVEGDSLCLTKVSGDIPYSLLFDDCFDISVDQASGTVAAEFPISGPDRFVLKERAFRDVARLQIPTRAPTGERSGSSVALRNTAPESGTPRNIDPRKSETERKLEKLRLEVELERLRQRRVSANDKRSPVIHAPKWLETKEETVTIKGLAEDDIYLVRLELNGKRVDTKDGHFNAKVPVELGRSKLRIAAFDSEGNKTEHLVTVTRHRNIPDIEFGKYYALVIGINDYETLPKLNTAVVDAQVVARTLEELYGYEVTLLTDPSRTDIIDVLDEYRDRLTDRDNLLIYYAGHGWLDQQTNAGYWLPVNAKADRRSRWLSNATLTTALQTLFAKHVMVVADSCYSGTLTRSVKVPDRNPAYIARMAEKRTRVVLSSGGLEPVADSGGGEHSVFATQFLKALQRNEGVLDGTRLYEQVRQSVVLNADQTPEYSNIRRSGHEGGDFLFVRKK